MNTTQLEKKLKEMPREDAERIARSILTENDLVTITKAARLLNTNRQRIAGAVSYGKLPAKKMDSQYHVSLQVTRLYLTGNRGKSMSLECWELWNSMYPENSITNA